MTIRSGLDYLAPLDVELIKNLGATFVCRYTSTLTAIEAEELSRAGIDIVLLHESSPTAYTGGVAAGEQAAQDALEASVRVGMKGPRPIYLVAADADVSGDPSVLAPFYEGASHILPVARIGGYQGKAAATWLLDNKLVGWMYQTAAWSEGEWEPRAAIRQTGFSHAWAIPGYDNDTSSVADFGQWEFDVPPAPTGPRPVTVDLRGETVNVTALIPQELSEARLYCRFADQHPTWHPHHLAAARAELVTMRLAVWRAANLDPAGQQRQTADWTTDQRGERYTALRLLTGWTAQEVKAA